MAILNNLIVNGSSRFLNTAYFQDVSIAGSAALASLSLSGTLSVTGATTLSGTLGVTGAATFGNITATGTVVFSKTQDLSGTANSSPALIVGGTATSTHMEFDCNEIHAKENGTKVADLYLNNQGGKVYLSGNSVYASGSTFVAPTAAINNATISGDLTVNGVLHSNEFIKNIVKAVGGQLYVSPTFQATSSTTISCVSADTSYVYLTLQDNGITSSEYAGATWYSGSRIMLSGTLTANTTGHTEEILFSSAPGELTAQMNGGTNGAKKLQIKVEHDNASTYFKAGNLTFSDVAVMMYQLKNGSNYFPIGIYIKAYGTDNQKSYIDIFGGSDTTPNARLGLLTGLGSMPSGSTIQGWGIYTDNGFFKGIIEANGGLIGNWTIGESSMYYSSDTPSNSSIVLAPGGKTASVDIGGSGTAQKSWVFTVKNLFGVDTSGALYSSSGKIGGWNIGTSSLYNTTNSMTSTGVGLYLGTDGIRNYASGTQYVNITGGKITALGVDVSGKITATSGAIGGFDITSTAIKTKNVAVTSNADNSISLSSADFTRTINSTSREGLRFAIGDKFGVTGDGTIYASSVDLTGKITATSGTIGGASITNGVLQIKNANIAEKITATNIEASTLTIGQSQVTGLSTALGNKADSSTVTALTNKVNAVYGTCGTAAATQIKTVTCSGFTLYDGALITVKFTNSNTFSSAKIIMNINSTGNKDVYVSGGITSSSNNLVWASGAEILFKYTGGAYTVVDNPKTWSGSCSSAETNPEKEVSIPGCVICKGAVVKVKMTYSNTANCGLNVSSTGNFSIHVKTGSDYPTVASGYSWTAGGTPEFVFNGIHWVLSSPDIESAKTATNYLYFDSNNGLVISQTGGASPSGYNTQINSTGMSIRNGSTTLASYGSSIILGELASGKTHIEIDSDSFDVCSGAATGANSTKLATFGTTITLGQIANGVTRVQIDNDSLDVISRDNGTDTTIATFGQTVTIGESDSARTYIDNKCIKWYSDETNIAAGINYTGGIYADSYVVGQVNEEFGYSSSFDDGSSVIDYPFIYISGYVDVFENDTDNIDEIIVTETINVGDIVLEFDNIRDICVDEPGAISPSSGYYYQDFLIPINTSKYGSVDIVVATEIKYETYELKYICIADRNYHTGFMYSAEEGYKLRYRFNVTFAKQTRGNAFYFGYSSMDDIFPNSANFHSTVRVGNYANVLNGDDYSLIIGNGTSHNNRSNALTIDWNGNMIATGNVMAANTSHIGMIIMSTTLNTMEAVIAIYGGTTWIQHSGYMLRGATSDVTPNSASSDGGSDTHNHGGKTGDVKLTAAQSGVGSHHHGTGDSSYKYWTVLTGGASQETIGSISGTGNKIQQVSSNYNYGTRAATNDVSAGASAAHNHTISSTSNVPLYKNVYIWERTA